MNKIKYWNNMQVEVVKVYPMFKKCKIRTLITNETFIVNKCSVTDIKIICVDMYRERKSK